MSHYALQRMDSSKSSPDNKEDYSGSSASPWTPGADTGHLSSGTGEVVQPRNRKEKMLGTPGHALPRTLKSRHLVRHLATTPNTACPDPRLAHSSSLTLS